MKQILIAGGTGLIGQRLTERLLEKGFHVSHLSRTVRKNTLVPTYKWDIPNKYIEAEALKDVDCLINLAGAGIADKHWTKQRKEKIINSRVQGNLLLKEFIQAGRLKPKKIIAGAAIGIYGNRGTEILDEASPVGREGFLTECCLAWEESIHQLAQTNVPLACLRIGIVLSTKGGALKKMIQAAKFGIASYFGNGKQVYAWIHIDDLVRIILYLIQQEDAVGLFNGTAPHPVTNKKLTRDFNKNKRRPGILLPVPTFALHLLLGEMKDVVLHGAHVLPKKILTQGFKFQYETIGPALKHLLT